jgi:hypothetical protein
MAVIDGVAIGVMAGTVTPFLMVITPIAWLLDRSAREWWRHQSTQSPP